VLECGNKNVCGLRRLESRAILLLLFIFKKLIFFYILNLILKNKKLLF
jgi:hypothetical protein